MKTKFHEWSLGSRRPSFLSQTPLPAEIKAGLDYEITQLAKFTVPFSLVSRHLTECHIFHGRCPPVSSRFEGSDLVLVSDIITRPKINSLLGEKNFSAMNRIDRLYCSLKPNDNFANSTSTI